MYDLATTIGTGSTLFDVALVAFIIVAVIYILDWLLGRFYRTGPRT